MGTLTSAELELLLTACAEHAPERHAEVVVLAYTGIRAGELYGLRWEDLDGDALRIRQSASKGHLTAPKGVAQWEGRRDVGASVLEEWAAALDATLEIAPKK